MPAGQQTPPKGRHVIHFAAADLKSKCLVLLFALHWGCLDTYCVSCILLSSWSLSSYDLVSITTVDTCNEITGCWSVIHFPCVFWEDRNLPEEWWLARASGVDKFIQF